MAPVTPREVSVADIRARREFLRQMRALGRRRPLPRQNQPDAIRVAYFGALLKLLERARAMVKARVIPALPELVRRAAEARVDDWEQVPRDEAGRWTGEAAEKVYMVDRLAATRKLYGPLANWIHYPDSTGKAPLLQAYGELRTRERAALAADVRAAFEREHGADVVVAYRYKDRPKHMGGMSLTTVRPDYLSPDKYDAFLVRSSDVLAHWGQAELPLGSSAFRHERELILKPDANPPRVGEIPWKDDGQLPGSLGIPRSEMPQIKSDLVPRFVEELRESGASVRRGRQPVSHLRPTQSKIHLENVRGMLEALPEEALKKPVIVSSDGYILDGHHRWAALYMKGPEQEIGTVTVGLPIRELLERARGFSKVTYKDAAEARTDETALNELLDEVTEEWFAEWPNARLARLSAEYAQRTSDFQLGQLSKQFKARLGFDLLRYEPWLGPKVQAFTTENVALIKSIPSDLFADLEKRIAAGLRTGLRWEELAETIEERFGVAESRAKLVARDQVGKLFGSLNEVRQRQLGVRRFTWRTMKDNRVRDEHEDLDGQKFGWAEDELPTGRDGGPIIPGEEINCRCWAEPDLDDLLAEAGAPDLSVIEGGAEEGEETTDADDREDAPAGARRGEPGRARGLGVRHWMLSGRAVVELPAGDDPALYHVTTEERLPAIGREGLRPYSMTRAGRGEHENHSSGRVFVTNRAGLSYWRRHVGQRAAEQHRDPPDVVVLRLADAARLELAFEVDEVGSAEAPAWHTAGIVEPGLIALVRLGRLDGWEDVPRDEGGRWTGSGRRAGKDDLPAKIATLKEQRAVATSPGVKAAITKRIKALESQAAGSAAAPAPPAGAPPVKTAARTPDGVFVDGVRVRDPYAVSSWPSIGKKDPVLGRLKVHNAKERVWAMPDGSVLVQAPDGKGGWTDQLRYKLPPAEPLKPSLGSKPVWIGSNHGEIGQVGEPGTPQPSPPNVSVPWFGDVEEAKPFLASLGVTSFRAKPEHLHVVNRLAVSLALARANGIEPPRQVTITVPKHAGEHAVAETKPQPDGSVEETLFINPVTWGTAPAASVPGHYFAASGEHATVAHELGHFLHARTMKASGKLDVYLMKGSKPLQDGERAVAKAVSVYATTSANEFVAEVHAGLTHGREFPPDVMALYGKFNGPPAKRWEGL